MSLLPTPCTGYHWFDIEYRMDDGTRWSLYVMAQSEEDAETRLRCIKVNGFVAGRVVKQVPFDDGEKGGELRCALCGVETIPAEEHSCKGETRRENDRRFPAPAPSRAPGNGETAEERVERAIEKGRMVNQRVGGGWFRPGSTTIAAIAEEIRAAESAARADERKVVEKVERFLEARLVDPSTRTAACAYQTTLDYLRALLAGWQEVAS